MRKPVVADSSGLPPSASSHAAAAAAGASAGGPKEAPPRPPPPASSPGRLRRFGSRKRSSHKRASGQGPAPAPAGTTAPPPISAGAHVAPAKEDQLPEEQSWRCQLLGSVATNGRAPAPVRMQAGLNLLQSGAFPSRNVQLLLLPNFGVRALEVSEAADADEPAMECPFAELDICTIFSRAKKVCCFLQRSPSAETPSLDQSVLFAFECESGSMAVDVAKFVRAYQTSFNRRKDKMAQAAAAGSSAAGSGPATTTASGAKTAQLSSGESQGNSGKQNAKSRRASRFRGDPTKTAKPLSPTDLGERIKSHADLVKTMVMELLFMALMGEPSGLMRVQETISSAVEKILAYVPASLHGDVPLLKEHLVFQCHVLLESIADPPKRIQAQHNLGMAARELMEATLSMATVFLCEQEQEQEREEEAMDSQPAPRKASVEAAWLRSPPPPPEADEDDDGNSEPGEPRAVRFSSPQVMGPTVAIEEDGDNDDDDVHDEDDEDIAWDEASDGESDGGSDEEDDSLLFVNTRHTTSRISFDMSYAQHLTTLAMRRISGMNMSTMNIDPDSSVISAAVNSIRRASAVNTRMDGQQQDAKSLSMIAGGRSMTTLLEEDEGSSDRGNDLDTADADDTVVAPENAGPRDSVGKAEDGTAAESGGAPAKETGILPGQTATNNAKTDDDGKPLPAGLRMERNGSRLLVVAGSISDLVGHLVGEAESHFKKRSEEVAAGKAQAPPDTLKEKLYRKLSRASRGIIVAATDTTKASFRDVFLLTYRSYMDANHLLDILHSEFTGGSAQARGAVLLIVLEWITTFWIDFRDHDALLDKLKFFVTAPPAAAAPASPEDESACSDCCHDPSGACQACTAACTLIQTELQSTIEYHLDFPLQTKPGARPEAMGPTDGILIHIESRHLAEQITLFNYDLFARVHPVEYVYYFFPKASGAQGLTPSECSPNLQVIIQRFDEESYWATAEICCYVKPKEQAAMITKFVHIAHHCLELGNFFSLFSILGALNFHQILRMKKAWKLVSDKTKRMRDRLEGLMDPSRNMKKYRDAFECAQDRPRIPFLPLHLKDLLFANEGCSDKMYEMVNFDKLRLVTRCIHNICMHKTYRSIIRDAGLQGYLRVSIVDPSVPRNQVGLTATDSPTTKKGRGAFGTVRRAAKALKEGFSSSDAQATSSEAAGSSDAASSKSAATTDATSTDAAEPAASESPSHRRKFLLANLLSPAPMVAAAKTNSGTLRGRKKPAPTSLARRLQADDIALPSFQSQKPRPAALRRTSSLNRVEMELDDGGADLDHLPVGAVNYSRRRSSSFVRPVPARLNASVDNMAAAGLDGGLDGGVDVAWAMPDPITATNMRLRAMGESRGSTGSALGIDSSETAAEGSDAIRRRAGSMPASGKPRSAGPARAAPASPLGRSGRPLSAHEGVAQAHRSSLQEMQVARPVTIHEVALDGTADAVPIQPVPVVEMETTETEGDTTVLAETASAPAAQAEPSWPQAASPRLSAAQPDYAQTVLRLAQASGGEPQALDVLPEGEPTVPPPPPPSLATTPMAQPSAAAVEAVAAPLSPRSPQPGAQLFPSATPAGAMALTPQSWAKRERLLTESLLRKADESVAEYRSDSYLGACESSVGNMSLGSPTRVKSPPGFKAASIPVSPPSQRRSQSPSPSQPSSAESSLQADETVADLTVADLSQSPFPRPRTSSFGFPAGVGGGAGEARVTAINDAFDDASIASILDRPGADMWTMDLEHGTESGSSSSTSGMSRSPMRGRRSRQSADVPRPSKQPSFIQRLRRRTSDVLEGGEGEGGSPTNSNAGTPRPSNPIVLSSPDYFAASPVSIGASKGRRSSLDGLPIPMQQSNCRIPSSNIQCLPPPPVYNRAVSIGAANADGKSGARPEATRPKRMKKAPVPQGVSPLAAKSIEPAAATPPPPEAKQDTVAEGSESIASSLSETEGVTEGVSESVTESVSESVGESVGESVSENENSTEDVVKSAVEVADRADTDGGSEQTPSAALSAPAPASARLPAHMHSNQPIASPPRNTRPGPIKMPSRSSMEGKLVAQATATDGSSGTGKKRSSGSLPSTPVFPDEKGPRYSKELDPSDQALASQQAVQATVV